MAFEKACRALSSGNNSTLPHFRSSAAIIDANIQLAARGNNLSVVFSESGFQSVEDKYIVNDG